MIERFKQLSERERLLVIGLGGLAALLVLISGIVMPILAGSDRAAADYERAARLAAMTENLQAAGTESVDDRALRSVVTERADRASITYTRINQTADGQLQIDISNAPNAAFFGWLDSLEKDDGIAATEAYVTGGDSPGTVEARITLARTD